MIIHIDYIEDKAIMKVEGMINGESSFKLQDRLKEVLDSGVNKLDIDFSECRSISSTGIGKLLIFYKTYLKTDKELRIVKCSENMFNLFNKIRFDQLIDIKR
ncbi:MAG: STAS domain-containing protein [Candidatus Cloacimonadota bacterium]|nr:STAS domain-containing protein [Candidatus Cloacimonadota bacterium]